MATQDDLITERAEDLYSSIMVSRDGFDDGQATDELCIEMLRQALKATRQEALREAITIVEAEQLENDPTNDEDRAYFIAIEHAIDALDRLASEEL